MNSTPGNIEQRIIDTPIDAYVDFRERFTKDGLNAPFPEFKPVVDFLVQELHSEYFQSILAEHKDLEFELNEVLTFLTHVNLSFDSSEAENYPYMVPFSKPFPYRPTIDAIESAIRLLDKLNRLAPDSKAVKLYHFDRYCYHRHSLVSSEEVVLIPTLAELSLVDFIKTRSVPVEFVGVISRTMRADGHYQSPLDFWYHDLNHARRLFAYITKREREMGLTGDTAKLRYYQQVNDFIQNVILPKIVTIPENATEEERALHNIATLIIFEIVHETALTLEKDEIVKDLLRANGPQPFEYMVDKKKQEESAGDLEALRTPTGNLESGASLRRKETNDTLEIKYIFDPTSVGLLTNIFGKINHRYYDDSSEGVNEHLVPAEYRKPEYIVKAAKLIFDAIEYTDYPSDEELLDLVYNREGTKERSFTAPVFVEDTENLQVATDPISADEVITRIKALNKKVFTLFGYSALEYEHKDKVLAQIKERLQTLDPKEYVINIGCTEEGIGAAYEVARSLGFETIGLVSTQALSYSGRFSPFVQQIFIVNDLNWGGKDAKTGALAQTTQAYLAVSDAIAAFGGGKHTAVVLEEAKQRGIPVSFTPAQMNHAKALKESNGKPVDFNGAAHYAWQQ